MCSLPTGEFPGMDAASFFNNGNASFVDEDYEEALKQFTVAIEALPDDDKISSVPYLVNRAAAYVKLGLFHEAVADTDRALVSEPGHRGANYRRGIALFYLGDYDAAKVSFTKAAQVDPDSKALKAWMRKCDAELSGSSLPLGQVVSDVSQKPALATASDTAPATKGGYSAAPAGSAEKETVATATPATTTPAPAAETSGNKTSISGRKAIRHEWYQSTTHVFLTIFAKKVNREKMTTEIQPNEVSIAFPLPGDEDEEFQMNLDLFAEIVPDRSKVDVSAVKIELSLEKKNSSVHWGSLEKVAVADPSADLGPAAYPSSKKVKKDWGQIDKEIEEELKNQKPEGDEALNKLFREIYGNADEETRRAMNKSFQTSGGTVLSTNWGEVGRADYAGKDRPTAPEGQEWADERAEKEKKYLTANK